MWTTIASLFFGAVPTIVESIGKAKKAALDAKTEQDKISANERVKSLEAQRDVLIAETKSPWVNIARFAFIVPIAVYVNWLILWDKLLCPSLGMNCSTDPLSDWLNGIAMVIIGFLFLDNSLKIIKR